MNHIVPTADEGLGVAPSTPADRIVPDDEHP
jgi:hypothetical protein